MNIDKYKCEDFSPEGYKDEKGCHWDDAEEFLQGSVLGFCCCGNPDGNLKYIASVMQHLLTMKDKMWENKMTYDEWTADGEKIGSRTALYFVYYFLDSKGFTEHGCSIPGWLEPDGLEFLEDVIELYDLDPDKYTEW